jgi:hypothetical protein
VDGLDLVDAGAHGLNDLEAAEGDAAGQTQGRTDNGPNGNTGLGAAINPHEDQHDANGFLRVVKGVVESQKGHVQPLGVCKELIDTNSCMKGQGQQQLQNQEAQQKADCGCQEDHQNDFTQK